MRKLTRWLSILFVFAILPGVNTAIHASDDIFGIKIEQRALDLLTLASQRMTEVLGSTDLEQIISIKARIVIPDLIDTGEITEPLSEEIIQQLPEVIVQTQIELFRSGPDQVRVNLKSNFGELHFLLNGSESLVALPEDGVFAEMDVPQMLPDKLMLKDDGGLFTLINLMGGFPFGSLLGGTLGEGEGAPDIVFGEVDQSNLRATIRYWGKDKTEAGVVHVVNILTASAAPYHQSIKIWIMEDTLDLYQFSIEDVRGTQVFIVIDELDTSPVFSAADFTLDLTNMVEVSEEEFLQTLVFKIVTSPAIEGPIAVDLSASSDKVACTGVLTVSTNGFHIQENEDELGVEMEYRSPGGTWKPLEVTEYAGLVPLGHWNAEFLPGETAELGLYSFRVRYIDSSGNASEWLEAPDLITVTPAPPRIVQTEPVHNNYRVPVSSSISVTFSKPMDKSSVEKNFSITTWLNRNVQGSFKWDGNTLIFSPSYDLLYDTTYLVTVAGEAKDTDGIGLDSNYDSESDGIPYDDYMWVFRTTSALPTLALESRTKPVTVWSGNRFSLRIMAKNVTKMQKFSFKLVFDPEVLKVEKIDRASFSSWRPRPRSIESVDVWSKPVIDNSSGFVTIACDSTRAGGVSGSGEIATISFHAIGAGSASFGFDEVSVDNAENKSIVVELSTIKIQVTEFHPMDINHDGVVDIQDSVAIKEGGNALAAPYSVQAGLGQNYPNPFNPETWIPYQLAKPSHVTVRIYSSTGELVRTLDMGDKEAGFYMDRTKAAHWDGMDNTGQKVSSGVYFYTIQADGFTATKKMLLRN